MMKVKIIHDIAEIEQLRATIGSTADIAVTALKELVRNTAGLNMLSEMRFQPIGRDPLDGDRPLNLVEQVNQTFTYLATLEAAEWLLQKHPGAAPFTLNLGTAGGPDIESVDGQLVAEVFAAVTPQNNRKLAKDVAKVAKTRATQRYVFFASPGETGVPIVRNVDGVFVTIVALKLIRGSRCRNQSTPATPGELT